MMGLTQTKNKQAQGLKGAMPLTHEYAQTFRDKLMHRYADDEIMYQYALTHGIPKELARIHLPVGRYSQMRAHTCLRNWLAFLTLRQDPAAQWEIRQYALAVSQLIAENFPRTYKLYAA